MTKSKNILKRYTPEEDLYIKENFEIRTLDSMALALGRTMGSVAGRCIRLGLKLTDELKQQRRMIGIEAGWRHGENTRFKKGHITWNKDTKGLTKANNFSYKKGNLPHNTKFDGCITLRSIHGKTKDKSKTAYLFIRLDKGNWDLLHRHLWRLHYGEIPIDANVQFSDGNQLNCTIENLELVSKSTNMKRNSIQNLPSDMKEIIQLNRQIKKFIKEYEQGLVTRS